MNFNFDNKSGQTSSGIHTQQRQIDEMRKQTIKEKMKSAAYVPDFQFPKEMHDWPGFMVGKVKELCEKTIKDCIELPAKFAAQKTIDELKSDNLPEMRVNVKKVLAESRDWNNSEGLRTRLALIYIISHIESYFAWQNSI